ncbi:hypothetical protein AAEX28_09975 [Lentisphaerota bacterium WC36G]|nr:hypothetical protein LJT99_12810 [Lentisphaerae bacterium WC36]
MIRYLNKGSVKMVGGFKRFGLLVLIGVTSMSANFVQAKRLSAQEIKEKILIIPIDKSYQKYSEKIMPRKLQAFKDEKLRAVAAKKSFVNWKTFEDEFISFSYPDRPDIKLEIKQQGDEISTSGGEVGVFNNSFFKGYRLAIGGHTYFALHLDRDLNYLDSGWSCECGAIELNYIINNCGTLLCFDLMGDGNVKLIQAMSDDLRIATSMSTHAPVSQEVFLEIGTSIKF